MPIPDQNDPFALTTHVEIDDRALAIIRMFGGTLEDDLQAITPDRPANFAFITQGATHWLLAAYYDPKVYGDQGGWELKGIPKAEFDRDAAVSAMKRHLKNRETTGSDPIK